MSDMTELRAVRAVLVDARALIADAGVVAVRAFARDARGHCAEANEHSAMVFCARGAVQAQAPSIELDVKAQARLEDATPVVPYITGRRQLVTTTNDEGGLAEVLRMYDRALAQVDEEIAEAWAAEVDGFTARHGLAARADYLAGELVA